MVQLNGTVIEILFKWHIIDFRPPMQKLEFHLWDILKPLDSKTTREALHNVNFSVFLQLIKLIYFQNVHTLAVLFCQTMVQLNGTVIEILFKWHIIDFRPPMQKLEFHLWDILKPLDSKTTREALHNVNFSVFLQLIKLIYFQNVHTLAVLFFPYLWNISPAPPILWHSTTSTAKINITRVVLWSMLF